MQCSAPELCSDGACSGDDNGAGGAAGGVCTAGETECATDKIRRVCTTEGTTFVAQACDDDEHCVEGECVVDTGAGLCDAGSVRCLDSSTALRCTAEGVGYEVTDCPDATACVDGACTGQVCRIGESHCAPGVGDDREARWLDCEDGAQWRYRMCPTGDTCVDDASGPLNVAACVPRTCAIGDRYCGDPTDSSVDATASFSVCEKLNDGTVGWARYQCSGQETCSPSSVTCRPECTPGEQACTSDRRGFKNCDANGEWAPSQLCYNTTEVLLECQQAPNLASGQLPHVVCSDPVCYRVQSGLGRKDGGVCEGGALRACGDDGRVSDVAVPCSTGICQTLSSTKYGGLQPGACNDDCQQGDERCVDGSPLYQTCEDGVWSSTTQTCPGNDVCFDFSEDGRSKRICGGECVPGTRRCSGVQIQACSAQGRWEIAKDCDLGECQGSSYTPAACTVECVPGAVVCSGGTRVASDGTSYGRTAEMVCTSQGLLPTSSTTCPGTETCRTSRTGETLGCVECVGTGAAGGNQDGLPDNRCSSVGEAVETCGSNNDWGTTAACGLNQSCVARTEFGVCTTCLNGLSNCSESSIQAMYGSPYTCSYLGLGAPMNCGGVSDCCSGYCSVAGDISTAHCE